MVSLVIGAIIVVKFFIKHLQNCAIPLNIWICCGFLGGGMFIIAYIFFRFVSFPYLEIIKPKIIPKNNINAHLSKFGLMSFFALLKT
jgi:hypothetical protein